MKNHSDAGKSSSISTPKKVALAVLGALTLLTLVNFIQADGHNHKEQAIHEEHDIAVHVDTDFEFESHSDNQIVVRVEKRHANFSDGELMIEESFKVSSGENLSVAVGDADINVETHEGDEAEIKVYLEARDMDKAREYFEDQNFEVTKDGSTIHVITRPVRKNYSWNRDGGAHIQVDVNIPVDFNVNLKSSDGDIALDKINGEVSIHTSDGDISTRTLTGNEVSIRTSDGDIATDIIDAGKVAITTSDGDIAMEDVVSNDISIRTSDGDIKAETLSGNSSVMTSDGDIIIQLLDGNSVAVRTSDGEIVAHEVIAGNSQFQTSDGSIVLKGVSGNLEAKTSSGNLNVTLVEGEKVYLKTGDGDIYIHAPEDYSAELSLRGERVRVSTGFQFDGKLKETEAEGRINGGEHTLEARTSDGEIVFREN